LSTTKISQGIIVKDVSFNPTDYSSIIAIGDGIFKLYKFADNLLKTVHSQLNKLPEDISSVFTTHIWLPDSSQKEAKLIVGTAAGDLLLLDNNGEFIERLESSPGNDWSIECFC
jgi:hypothetical protein